MSDKKPTIIISGFGRCGTTMLMGMLHAAGVPVVADSYASFESNRFTYPDHAIDWSEYAGKAIKVLDPHRWTFRPTANLRFVFLSRDPKEQAKSQLKLLGMGDAADRRRITASLRKDGATVMGCFRGHPVLRLSYEIILAQPLGAASDLACFLQIDTAPAIMAAIVQQRSPKCAPNLDFEFGAVRAEFSKGTR